MYVHVHRGVSISTWQPCVSMNAQVVQVADALVQVAALSGALVSPVLLQVGCYHLLLGCYHLLL